MLNNSLQVHEILFHTQKQKNNIPMSFYKKKLHDTPIHIKLLLITIFSNTFPQS